MGWQNFTKKTLQRTSFLSIPENSYHLLNTFLTLFFEKVPGANIETSSLIARQKLETLELETNDQIVSLDVTNLYTNVPVSKAIEFFQLFVYSNDTPFDIERSTLKLLFKLPFRNVYFKSNGNWYCEKRRLEGFPCSYLGQYFHEKF